MLLDPDAVTNTTGKVASISRIWRNRSIPSPSGNSTSRIAASSDSCRRQRQTGGRRAGLDNLQVLLLQDLGDQLAIGRIIINHKDS